MKRKILFIGLTILISTILILNRFSHSLNIEKIKDDFNKIEIYNLIIDNKLNLDDNKQLDIITNWYEYFEIEDMFLTKDGEYIDYITYEIYRVHLNNQYHENKRAVAKKLLKSTNYPREDNPLFYEECINEYVRTTGKEI